MLSSRGGRERGRPIVQFKLGRGKSTASWEKGDRRERLVIPDGTRKRRGPQKKGKRGDEECGNTKRAVLLIHASKKKLPKRKKRSAVFSVIKKGKNTHAMRDRMKWA